MQGNFSLVKKVFKKKSSNDDDLKSEKEDLSVSTFDFSTGVNTSIRNLPEISKNHKKHLKSDNISSLSKVSNIKSSETSFKKGVEVKQKVGIGSKAEKVEEFQSEEQLQINDEKLVDEWQEVKTKRHKKNRGSGGGFYLGNAGEKGSELDFQFDEEIDDSKEGISGKKFDWYGFI